jgi:hypothetical protein
MDLRRENGCAVPSPLTTAIDQICAVSVANKIHQCLPFQHAPTAFIASDLDIVREH